MLLSRVCFAQLSSMSASLLGSMVCLACPGVVHTAGSHVPRCCRHVPQAVAAASVFLHPWKPLFAKADHRRRYASAWLRPVLGLSEILVLSPPPPLFLPCSSRAWVHQPPCTARTAEGGVCVGPSVKRVCVRVYLCVSRAAVASGTSSVMGAPFGALMFSVEVTASFYLVRCRPSPHPRTPTRPRLSHPTLRVR